MKKIFVFGGLLSCLPMMASNSENLLFAGFGLIAVVLIVTVVLNILFLMAQSAFAKSMKLANKDKETSSVWIWTQLIPLWNLVAIPITLLKINEQYKTYVLENDSLQVESYSSTWGWVWYISSILSIFFPILGLVSLVGLIGFWIHVSKVKKSIEANKI